jgi:hypothetical protein
VSPGPIEAPAELDAAAAVADARDMAESTARTESMAAGRVVELEAQLAAERSRSDRLLAAGRESEANAARWVRQATEAEGRYLAWRTSVEADYGDAITKWRHFETQASLLEKTLDELRERHAWADGRRLRAEKDAGWLRRELRVHVTDWKLASEIRRTGLNEAKNDRFAERCGGAMDAYDGCTRAIESVLAVTPDASPSSTGERATDKPLPVDGAYMVVRKKRAGSLAEDSWNQQVWDTRPEARAILENLVTQECWEVVKVATVPPASASPGTARGAELEYVAEGRPARDPDEHDALANFEREWCHEVAPHPKDKAKCTRPPRHDGDHVASGKHLIFARWAPAVPSPERAPATGGRP